MATTLERASGRWPELLMALAGLSPEQLTDTHQPCPACGGADRYRWDRDDGPGGCYCNQCGGKDHAGGGMSGLDLLLRVTGWDLKQAIRRVRSHLDPGGTIDTTPAAAAAPPAKKPKRPARIPDRPPAGTPPPDLGGAVAQWPYLTADDLEQPAFWIQRVDTATGKLFIHRTWLDGRWHYPSKRDAFTSEWPAPRPLYRLPELIARPDAPVLIAEGEKAADAGATLLPDHVVIAWCGGVAGLNHTDWSPLAGRIVILWPDNDDPGRKAMAKLGQRLLGLGCAVSIFNPPDGCPPKWDLANAIAESWATKHIRHLLTKVVKLQPLPEPAPAPESPPPPPPAPPVEISEFSQYFDCLGTDGDGFYYKIHATGHVKRLSAGAHTSTHLVFLAPVAFWESAFPGGRSGANWTAAASRLAQLQASVGFYDESQVRSCGAWWDRGRCVLNLGDRLVVDGIEQSIRKPVPNSRFIYRGGKALRGTDGATPLSDDEAMMIGLIAEQFLWEVKASGPLLAGWVTLAPICGVLDWRPHIWLTASAESGKSTVLNRYIAPLLGSMAVSAYGQSSEAGIRQTLDSKAIAVIFDEAESNEKSDKARMQNVLTLARIASTESDAQMLKGSPEGKSTGYSIRSMFLLCSIATALKQGADKTRFAQLTLQNPSILGEARHARWKELDEHLDQFITPEIGRRLQARTISLIPMIREATKAFVDATARKFNSRRMGDQYGTLLAGAWSLRYTHAPTPDEARAFLDTIDGWEPYREESTGTPDERSCIEAILQFQVRVEGERSAGLARTVAELIDMTDPVNVSPTDPITSKGAKEHLGRVGLKVQDGRLYIHNNAAGIRRILAETPWSDCWPTVLRRLPDARKEAATNFFGHRGNHRATSVPLTALDQV